jgi:6-phosphogluconate dehydrogenase
MQLAMIGLGRMGGNMSERLMRDGHEMVVFDRSADAIAKYERLGAKGAKNLADVVSKLNAPRIVWIMVPAGKPVDDTIASLIGVLHKEEVIIDG